MLAFPCDICERSLCERQQLIALALGYDEDTFCPHCLAQKQGIDLDTMLQSVVTYIHSRDCFKKPWVALANEACPLLTLNQPCLCKPLMDTPAESVVL